MVVRRAPYLADRRNLIRGSLWNAVGWVVALLTGPPVMVALVRSMSHTEFGLLAIASAITGPASAVAALGLGPAITQIGSTEAVSRGDAGVEAAVQAGLRVAHRALPWVAVGSACLVGVVAAINPVRPAVVVVLVLLPVVLIAPLASVFDGFLRLTASMNWIAGATSFASAIGAAGIIAVIVVGTPSAVTVAAIRCGGALGAAAVLGWAVVRRRRLLRLSAMFDPSDTRAISLARFRAFSGAMLLTGVGWLLISQFDVLFLGADRGRASAGLYAPASRVADMGITVAALVGTLLLPTLTTALRSGHVAKAVHLYHWTSRWAFVATAPLLAMMFVVPGSVLHLLFGGGFSDVANALRVLGLGVLMQVGFGFNGFMLEAHGFPRLAAIRSGFGILVTVALCAALIPAYSFTGAAIATAGAIGVVNVFSSWTLFRRFQIAPWDVAFLLAVLGFALSLALSLVITSHIHDDPARCAFAAVLALAGAGIVPLTSRTHLVAPIDQDL